jgi:hypothetical protein
MNTSARVAMGLWLLFAIVVFSVRFDWLTHAAGLTFVQQQVARQHDGLPPVSINDGFRPMVRDAARRSAVWLLTIAVAGSAATTLAARAR